LQAQTIELCRAIVPTIGLYDEHFFSDRFARRLYSDFELTAHFIDKENLEDELEGEHVLVVAILLARKISLKAVKFFWV